MAAAAAPYGALTLTVVKIGSLAANDVVVGFIDEFNRGRLYSPISMDGLAPQTGDAANVWLPHVGTVTQVTDPTGGATGPWKVTLIPGTSDTVNAGSVQNVVLDQGALVIKATSTW